MFIVSIPVLSRGDFHPRHFRTAKEKNLFGTARAAGINGNTFRNSGRGFSCGTPGARVFGKKCWDLDEGGTAEACLWPAANLGTRAFGKKMLGPGRSLPPRRRFFRAPIGDFPEKSVSLRKA